MSSGSDEIEKAKAAATGADTAPSTSFDKLVSGEI